MSDKPMLWRSNGIVSPSATRSVLWLYTAMKCRNFQKFRVDLGYRFPAKRYSISKFAVALFCVASF